MRPWGARRRPSGGSVTAGRSAGTGSGSVLIPIGFVVRKGEKEMGKKSYWIKERHNPQFEKPYYTACGQLTIKEAKSMENSLYGSNYMLRFHTKDSYVKKILQLRKNGFSVR